LRLQGERATSEEVIFMSSDKPNDVRAGRPSGADDLACIRGISPKIATRLYEAGILTFEKLAAMTPSEIVARIGAASGITAELIAKRDWIGQATEFAAKAATTESAIEAPGGESGQHSVSYVVQFTLNEYNQVQSTKAHHIQSGDEQSWDNWDETKLVGFFAQRPELNLSKEKPAAASSRTPPASTAQTDQPAQAAIEATSTASSEPVLIPTIAPCLRKLEMIQEATQLPSWILSHNQPFRARLNLDLTGVAGMPQAEINYSAIVRARGIGNNQVHIIGEAQGTLKPATNVTLDVKGNSLPPGFYHIFAAVTLALEKQSAPHHTLRAFGERSPLEVY